MWGSALFIAYSHSQSSKSRSLHSLRWKPWLLSDDVCRTSPIILVGLQLRFSVWINMMLWGKLVPVLQVIITLKVQNQYLTFNITIARYLAWRARKRPFMFLNPLSPSSESSPLYWDKLYYGLCDFLFLLLTLLWMRFLCFNNGRVLRWLPFWKVHCLNNVAH